MRGRQKNIQELIKWANDYLISKKLFNPKLIAELVAEEITGEHRIKFYLEPETILSLKQEQLFRKRIRRCGRKIPLAYVAGRCYFMGDVFFIRPGVFIPRPETELLVEKSLHFLEWINKEHSPQKVIVADIGTGSGNIAISIAKRIKNAFIYATDISSIALQTAKKNAVLHEVSHKIDFLQSDLFSALHTHLPTQNLHLVASNPPYIEKNQMRYLPPEVKKEPELSLDGGEGGLAFYRRMIPDSHHWLIENGALLLEIGYNQANQVAEIVYNSYKRSPQIFYDLNGNARIISIHKYK